jgi:type IV secretion system protein VirB10
MVTSDVYSANGRVLLIERMSEVQGEYAAAGQPGQRRVYVLWSRIRKPGGITVELASPSTDQLGAAGIDGIVDNRWFERVGSAYMLSILKDFLGAQAAGSAGSAAGATVYQNTLATSNGLAEKVLASSINIKPTIYANQGDRVSIYVARDLDFSNVYAVRPARVQ